MVTSLGKRRAVAWMSVEREREVNKLWGNEAVVYYIYRSDSIAGERVALPVPVAQKLQGESGRTKGVGAQ